MKTTDFDQEDPRLTAYALGEMEPVERAEFESWLRDHPEAQRAVDEIRATADLLGSALAEEAAPPANNVIPWPPASAAAATEKPPADDYRRKRHQLLSFPALYYVTAGLAAACFAVVLFNSAESEARKGQHLIALDEAMVDKMRAAAAATRAEVARTASLESRAVAAAAAPVRQEQQLLAVELPPLTVPTPVAAVEAPALTARGIAAAPSASPLAPPPGVVHSGQQLGYGGNGAVAQQSWAATNAAPRAKVVARARAQNEVQLDKFEVTGTAQRAEGNTEAYAQIEENPFLSVAQNPLSTFSVDVDTASYANVRRYVRQGRLPPRGAVRVEELVNYFPYRYAPPTNAAPFAAHLEVASAPWAPTHRLVRIGLKGRELNESSRPRANLVFLLDVSGSMNEGNKLPLVRQSLRLLLERLRADDRVAIVVYAGASGLALPSTTVREKAKIIEAIEELHAGGSTNGASGIQLAYDIAKANFIAGGVNRVVLATDGDFNVGVADESALTDLVREKAQSGVFLSVLGFGMGNLKDSTLELLADKGNGNYAYIDSLAEARKTLVEQAGGTLVTIAKDVKLQVEFNPAQAQAYRLIGYENRLLRKEDFNNDKVDAGEIGAGHTVTALYEVVPVGVPLPSTGEVDGLKYQRVNGTLSAAGAGGELLTLKLRYKEPAGDRSSLLEFPLRDSGHAFAQASADFKFAAAVAAFGMRLRESAHRGNATMTDVASWAREGLESDAGGYRAEFLGLVEEVARLGEN